MDDEDEVHSIDYDDPFEEDVWYPHECVTKRVLVQVVRSNIAKYVVDGKMPARNEIDDWSVLGV
jgi:hypothetical protein